MKTLTGLALASLIAFALVSCNKATNPEVDPPSVIGFDYSTTQDATLNLSVTDLNGGLISGVSVSLYFENPLEKSSVNDSLQVPNPSIFPIATFQTTNATTAHLELTIPKTVDSIYIFTNTVGFINPTVLAVKNITPNLTLRPAGYGVQPSAQLASPLTYVSSDPSNLGSNLWSMGSWSSQGVPSYLVTPNDVINSSMRSIIAAAVPEYVRAPVVHPEYFNTMYTPNIRIDKDAAAWVTFVTEGAGYRSVMGYFIYPTDNPPLNASQIDRRNVIFPNCSFSGSGGGMVEGMKVQLKYYNSQTGQYQDRIAAGNSIGWFLLPDGFNDAQSFKGVVPLYSFNSFNPGSKQQTIVLSDPLNQKYYISFEDIRRDSPNYGSDEDFNDVIFYVTSNPYDAIYDGDKPVVHPPKDTDGDGVYDYNDAYPDDPTLAYDYYYPAKNVYGTVAYEDLWPATGDYDFNDLVVDLNVHQQLNAQNRVVRMFYNTKVRAIGGSYHNGFAIALGNLAASSVRSVSGQRLAHGIFNKSANGTEVGSSVAIIPIFDNAYDLFGNQSWINTIPGKPTHVVVPVNLTIEFNSPITQSSLGSAPYDPFIIVNGERGREVHQINKQPSALANRVYLNTEQDASNVATGKYYLARDGRPWVISTPVSFAYPIEKANIQKGYLHFHAWANSAGSLYSNWYTNGVGYRDGTLIFSESV